jgi:hypothetical protein
MRRGKRQKKTRKKNLARPSMWEASKGAMSESLSARDETSAPSACTWFIRAYTDIQGHTRTYKDIRTAHIRTYKDI